MEDLNGLEKHFVDQHKIQLETSGVPKHLWTSLFKKLQGQVYDAGENFQLCRVTYSEGEREEGDALWQVAVVRQGGIKASSPDSIYLIDHAWTYRPHEAREHLRDIPGLLARMAALMDIPVQDRTQDQLLEKVLVEMWKYNDTYSLVGKTAEERLPMWYVMDEFGARIQHNGEPNFRVVPLYYAPHQCCYSLLFPIQDVDEGDEVTRNYVETPPVDAVTRDAQMLPWFPEDLTHVDPRQQEPSKDFFEEYSRGAPPPPLPAMGVAGSVGYGHMAESLPEGGEVAPLPQDRVIKVYSEYEYVREYLTDPRFTVTDVVAEADIIWLVAHFKDFKGLREKPHCRINQFPCEHLLTVKDLLAVVCRRMADKKDVDEGNEEECGPAWLPVTYCLKRELAKFVSYFQRREKRGEDNTWIVKPWNLARGLDHTITDSLNHILRLPATGPKIAQKYLANPVLFHRDDINADVKFDVRYIVMLLNVKPLKVAVYRRFWIRFANETFDLTQLDNASKHFTVNNYNDQYLLQMFCHDFIAKFNAQYPEHPWKIMEKELYEMFRQVFEAATSCDAPMGIPDNGQCKGFYGFDVMLQWTDQDENRTMKPVLLEVNFNSDCKRACEYYPEFFNDVFSVMFLGEEEGRNVAILE